MTDGNGTISLLNLSRPLLYFLYVEHIFVFRQWGSSSTDVTSWPRSKIHTADRWITWRDLGTHRTSVVSVESVAQDFFFFGICKVLSCINKCYDSPCLLCCLFRMRKQTKLVLKGTSKISKKTTSERCWFCNKHSNGYNLFWITKITGLSRSIQHGSNFWKWVNTTRRVHSFKKYGHEGLI